MIKRVISADNVMDTALVRLFVERGLQQLGKIANVTEQGNKDSITYYAELQRYVLIFVYSQYHPLSAQRSPPYKPSGQSFCHTVAVHNSRVVPLWQFIAGSAARFSDRTISPPGRGATGGDRRDSQDSQ